MAGKLSRRELARYVASQLADGASQQKVALQLAAYLIESRRTNELTVIVRDITAQLANLGYVNGTLTSAHTLTAATKRALVAYVKDKTSAAHVNLDTVVDESVLGGVKLEIPGHELDTTIARSLDLLKTRYKKA